ncbi:lysophospholipid acyltransferase family protein [Zeaxanthinibacter enoshimensis]|uniref:lysophospholipid acyltransferase family protein n=1 Tax=Zeaxanthinibacter enoshimensis TaxID=392009 RepID=UPI0035649D7D
MHKLAEFLFYDLMGWKFSGTMPQLKKCVFIVAPHTSNFDFILGLIVREILQLKINYIGKHSLFRPPWGWFFRKTGGAPIDRGKSSDTVKATAKIFEERDEFRLALSPEGTRKKVKQWKTGFYYIALTAGVPIVMVAFDFGKKEVKISQPLNPSGDIETDFITIRKFYEGVVGKVAARG